MPFNKTLFVKSGDDHRFIFHLADQFQIPATLFSDTRAIIETPVPHGLTSGENIIVLGFESIPNLVGESRVSEVIDEYSFRVHRRVAVVLKQDGTVTRSRNISEFQFWGQITDIVNPKSNFVAGGKVGGKTIAVQSSRESSIPIRQGTIISCPEIGFTRSRVIAVDNRQSNAKVLTMPSAVIRSGQFPLIVHPQILGNFEVQVADANGGKVLLTLNRDITLQLIPSQEYWYDIKGKYRDRVFILAYGKLKVI